MTRWARRASTRYGLSLSASPQLSPHSFALCPAPPQRFNIHINGTYHCSVRYSELASFHEKVVIEAEKEKKNRKNMKENEEKKGACKDVV